MQTIESLRRVILRIANYIYKCKNEYQIANVDLNHVAKFIKIRKLFVWDDCIDIEAISTLSMLCQKKGMNSFFEYNCKIVFQQSGCHKEIGVTSTSSITIEQQEFLIDKCFPADILTLAPLSPTNASVEQSTFS